jgi:hypothetical protein
MLAPVTAEYDFLNLLMLPDARPDCLNRDGRSFLQRIGIGAGADRPESNGAEVVRCGELQGGFVAGC